MSTSPAVGQVWRIVAVHHPCFANRIGREVVLVRATSNPGVFWCMENRPLQTRINRLGREVVSYDPRCIQTLYNIEHLAPVPGRAPVVGRFSR